DRKFLLLFEKKL
ncbi:unnamed protein product, partial [Diabrotica balteata]